MMIMALTPKLRPLGACVPVDEHSTWLASVATSHIQSPVIGKILAWISAYLELKLLHPDDERLLDAVEPQHPTMGSYRLIRADKGIGLWLRHVDKQMRQELPAFNLHRRHRPASSSRPRKALERPE